MDSNGYNPSIFDTKQGICYISKIEGDTARHELFGGAHRSMSKAQGFWINISPRYHTIIHDGTNDLKMQTMVARAVMDLKEDCKRFYLIGHSELEWFRLFNKNYMERTK